MKTAIQTKWFTLGAICSLALWSPSVRASIAYGSINNFDTVNDTGHECHGFEIEMEDCRSTEVTYTFNYNHYGTPKITEDNSVAGIPKSITASASPTTGGMTAGSGSYLTGVSATVVATPNPGYAFSKWQEGGTTVSNAATYTFDVTGDRTLVAKFNEAFVIMASPAPAIGGSTEMDTLTPYKANEKATAKAFPDDGWSFANWTENGTVVSTDSSYSFNVTGNRTLVANFTWDAGVTITTSPSTAIGGTTSGDGPYTTGDEVMVSAVENGGYAFVKWTENGLEVGTDPDYFFTADANRRLVAQFTPLLHIMVAAAPPAGGTISGDGQFIAGDTVDLTAFANPGFAFGGWTEDGNPVSDAETFSFTVAGNRSLVANFITIPRLVATPGAAGSNTLILSWPADTAGWTLQECADCASWLPSGRAVITVDDQNTVTVPTTEGHRFFRLTHP
ncbi:MAG: hypothetical protein K9M97_08070 [Akkermansiaceae bacterium]|nr:hypothetical protein [Akkermansiaceae bacterium]